MNIQTGRDVWIGASILTAVSLVITSTLILIMFPSEMYGQILPRGLAIAVLITMPLGGFVCSQVLRIRKLSEDLKKMVNRDRLTDVATRDFFFNRMARAPEAYGVSLMVDIDHFKKVNDNYGHMAGDLVIREVADILRRECRVDDIVCRFGGEEFVIFLCEASEERGRAVAERIRAAVETAEIRVEGINVAVTVSIGGSLKSQTDDINRSIVAADEALYLAKNTGRNRAVLTWLSSEDVAVLA